MKKKREIYRQINRVCTTLVGVIGIMVCLIGCSPKEREIIWSEQNDEWQVEASGTQGNNEQDEMSESPQETQGCGQNVTDVQVNDDEQGEVCAQDKETQTILVHVCGAVQNPSVVELETGSRASDALEAAGGFVEAANKTYVNLAAEVVDGQQLFFPTQEEVATMEARQLMKSVESANAVAGGQAVAKVNINTADENTLCTLPGIGASRAQAIIEYREQNGPFVVIEDIMNVSGIKTSAYEKIQDKITVQ